jgi:hypothetical protein
MQRRFVDISETESRNLEKDGNIDFRYWHNKSNDEKLRAAAIMISIGFNEPHFLEKKIDRTIYSSRKHAD